MTATAARVMIWTALLACSAANAAPSDDGAMVTLPGNHPVVGSNAQDRGPVEPAHMFSHMLLGLKRAPDMQRALDRLVDTQQDPASPNYHHWLKPADLRRFAPSDADTKKVVAWLQSKGLVVNAISPSGMTIDFAGATLQMQDAFRTPLHRMAVAGTTYIVNTTDAAVPAALASVIDGVTLSNLFPRPNLVPKSAVTVPTGTGTPFYAVGPADFATIYNLNPLLHETGTFSQPITGAGVTIAVVEQTNSLAQDWYHFRKYFGLSSYAGSFSILHPDHCGDPGLTPDETEAALDAEWAGATAPDAYIVEASCPATETTFGVMTTLRNLVEGTGTNATIYSISYGGCEQQDGLPFLNMWTNLVEEGAAEGTSILVSSGDSGASCDRDAVDQNGLGVNGLAASRYVTSVGGTDFADTVRGQLPDYWSKQEPSDGHGSALSYIPEIPWDNSCANSVIAHANAAAGGLAFCNTFPNNVQNGVGGTGGPSLVFSKPSWQTTTIPGVPNDGARDQPDVSFFAANGYWDHAYLICMSDEREGGAPCVYTGFAQTGLPNAVYQAFGGTSVSTPAFGGILALITQVKQAPLGIASPRLYQLAHLQFENKLLARSCNASLGRLVSKACIFNNVTEGDIAEPCYPGTPDCHADSTSYVGVLSAQNGKSTVAAYPATKGFSLATGLGSINATNLAESY